MTVLRFPKTCYDLGFGITLIDWGLVSTLVCDHSNHRLWLQSYHISELHYTGIGQLDESIIATEKQYLVVEWVQAISLWVFL